MSISPPRTKLIVSHCWLLKHSRVKMSASRFLVHNKVHFLLRVNDLFRLDFVHIWGQGCHHTTNSLFTGSFFICAALSRILDWIKTRGWWCSLSRLTKTNVGDRSQGRERVSIIWLHGPAGGVMRLTNIGAHDHDMNLYTAKSTNYKESLNP